jgi:hypothetical protein
VRDCDWRDSDFQTTLNRYPWLAAGSGLAWMKKKGDKGPYGDI